MWSLGNSWGDIDIQLMRWISRFDLLGNKVFNCFIDFGNQLIQSAYSTPSETTHDVRRQNSAFRPGSIPFQTASVDLL